MTDLSLGAVYAGAVTDSTFAAEGIGVCAACVFIAALGERLPCRCIGKFRALAHPERAVIEAANIAFFARGSAFSGGIIAGLIVAAGVIFPLAIFANLMRYACKKNAALASFRPVFADASPFVARFVIVADRRIPDAQPGACLERFIIDAYGIVGFAHRNAAVDFRVAYRRIGWAGCRCIRPFTVGTRVIAVAQIAEDGVAFDIAVFAFFGFFGYRAFRRAVFSGADGFVGRAKFLVFAPFSVIAANIVGIWRNIGCRAFFRIFYAGIRFRRFDACGIGTVFFCANRGGVRAGGGICPTAIFTGDESFAVRGTFDRAIGANWLDGCFFLDADALVAEGFVVRAGRGLSPFAIGAANDDALCIIGTFDIVGVACIGVGNVGFRYTRAVITGGHLCRAWGSLRRPFAVYAA